MASAGRENLDFLQIELNGFDIFWGKFVWERFVVKDAGQPSRQRNPSPKPSKKLDISARVIVMLSPLRSASSILSLLSAATAFPNFSSFCSCSFSCCYFVFCSTSISCSCWRYIIISLLYVFTSWVYSAFECLF